MADSSSIIINPSALGLYGRNGYPTTPERVGIPGNVQIAVNGSALATQPPATDSSGNPVALSLYGQLHNAFDQLGNNLNQARPAFQASVSDLGIARAEVSGHISNSTLVSINVTQLAQSQQLRSISFTLPTDNLGSGSLRIDFGSYDRSNNSFNSNGNPTQLSLPATGVSLQTLADTINHAGLPLKASIAQTDSGYQLVLDSTQTGTSHTLRITLSDSSSSTNGLAQLTYDPTASAAPGSTLSEARPAQDALFTVDGKPASSNSNQLTNVIPGVTITLAQTGSFNVQTSTPFSGILHTAEQIVRAYNQFVSQPPQQATQESRNKTDSASNNNPLSERKNALLDWVGQQKNDLGKMGIEQDSSNTGLLKLNRQTLFDSWSSNPLSSQNWLEQFRQGLQQQSQLNPALQQLNPIGQYYQANNGLGG